MKLILFSLITGLLTTGTGQNVNYHNIPACVKSAEIMETSPSFRCLVTEKNATDCMETLTNDPHVSSEKTQELLALIATCTEIIMQQQTEELHTQLTNRRKEVNCNRHNLNEQETFFCKQSAQNIQKMNTVKKKKNNDKTK